LCLFRSYERQQICTVFQNNIPFLFNCNFVVPGSILIIFWQTCCRESEQQNSDNYRLQLITSLSVAKVAEYAENNLRQTRQCTSSPRLWYTVAFLARSWEIHFIAPELWLPIQTVWIWTRGIVRFGVICRIKCRVIIRQYEMWTILNSAYLTRGLGCSFCYKIRFKVNKVRVKIKTECFMKRNVHRL